MSGSRPGLLLLAAIAVLMGGCGHRNGVAGDAGMMGDEAMIRVSNENWSDMNIYVVQGSARTRLGTVGSFTSRDFKLPSYVLVRGDEARLLADPIGATRPHVSEPLSLGPGQQLEWQIQNPIAQSSLRVLRNRRAGTGRGSQRH